MIELRTFGQLDLRDAQGEQISSVLQHPKRLALLVYLAAARPRGFHRRDTLLALLWPELDETRARAALRKAAFNLRRSLGQSVLVSRGDDDLAVDFTAVSCDAAQLGDAQTRQDAQSVVQVYHGNFLQGFFVGDAPAFEHWAERERQHLHGLAFRATWLLAEQAERNGDGYGAAQWARRAAALTPDDEPALRKLMELLDRLGDRAGAIGAYEDFSRRMRREYDTYPSLATRAIAQTIRARDAEPAQVTIDAAARPAPAATEPKRRRRKLTAALALTGVILTYAVSGIQPLRLPRAAPGRVVAVMPFSFRGSQELSYLGDGMVNLLSTNLDQLGDFRATDAAAVLSSNAGHRAFAPARASAQALQLGAGLFVTGDIVEVNGRLRVSASLYDARRPDRALARASAEDDVARLFELIDAITSQLVAGDRRAPAERLTRLALLTTHSVSALRSYLIGEKQFRDGRYTEAVESFQSAVQADSTFALGYYRLALAHMWGSNDSDRMAADRAVAYAQRLAGPDRALLAALRPFFRGDAEEAERQYRAILVTRPEESEVWYPLGEVLFHHNPVRGKPAAEAKHAFERALSLGPKDGPLTHLLEIAALERDWVAFDSLFSGIQPASHFFLVGEMIQAFRGGDAKERDRVLSALRDSSDARLTTAARHMLFLLEEPTFSELVLNLMIESGRPHEVRSWGYVHRAHLAVSGGRPSGALAELGHAAQLDRSRALAHEAWLLSFPFMQTSRAQIGALRNRLDAMPAVTPSTTTEEDLVLRGDREIHAHVRLYLLGLLDAQLGDYASALRCADQLSQLGGTSSARDLATDLMHAVRAEVLRLRGRHAEALAELERTRIQFDANRLNIAPFYAQVRERYVRGELLAALGKNEEALGWLASFDEHGPWGRAVLAPAALQQARIHDRLGHNSEAARQYSRFLYLWQNAEPRFATSVTEAKQRLAALHRAN